MSSEKAVRMATVVFVAVVVAAEVVSGNYSIAKEGSKAVGDIIMGDSSGANEHAVQAGKECKEVVQNWAGYTKDKLQDRLRLDDTDDKHSAGLSEVGHYITDQAKKGKEKVYQMVKDDSEASTSKAQVWKVKAQQWAQEALENTIEEEDKAQQNREEKAHEAQQPTAEDKVVKKEEQWEEAEAEAGVRAKAEAGSGSGVQENLSWDNGGYGNKKRKVSAKKKESLTKTSPPHREEL